MDNCSLKAVSLMFLLLPFLLSSCARRKRLLLLLLIYSKKLIYETQNNLYQLRTHMSTLIMWHNRFSESENEAAEVHIPRHRDPKTKKL